MMQNKTDDDHKITVSFGKSSSKYYSEAVEKAKLYSTYHMSEGKHVITLPIHKLDTIEQVKNLSELLDLIVNWKSATLEIDGEDFGGLQLFIDIIKDKSDSTLCSKEIALQYVLRKNGLEEMSERNLENLYLIYSRLSFRERMIIELRYGLEDGKRYTLKEIGNKFGISYSRVGQIITELVSHLGSAIQGPNCDKKIQKVQRTKEGSVPFSLNWLISLNWLTKDKIDDICKNECRRKNSLKLDMINQLRYKFKKDINLFKPNLDLIQHKILIQLLRKYLEKGRKIKVRDDITGNIISDDVAEEYSEIEKELEEYLKKKKEMKDIFKDIEIREVNDNVYFELYFDHDKSERLGCVLYKNIAI